MGRSDSLQARILRELISPSSPQWNVRQSYASVARKLGVDEETVRIRVKHAQESGFLLGWELVLNPHAIHRESASMLLEVDDMDRKPAVISQIRLLEGVIFIFDFYERDLQVVLFYENEQELARKVQLIGLICRSTTSTYWKNEFPPSDFTLRRTDWQIVKALRSDPRKSISDIAKEVKISARTVKRRLTLMEDARAFYLHPKVNVKKSPGMTYHFLVSSQDGKKSRVDQVLRSKLAGVVYVDTAAKQYSVFATFCSNISEAEETRRWIMSLEGVRDVRMHMMKEMIPAHDWFNEKIEKHI